MADWKLETWSPGAPDTFTLHLVQIQAHYETVPPVRLRAEIPIAGEATIRHETAHDAPEITLKRGALWLILNRNRAVVIFSGLLANVPPDKARTLWLELTGAEPPDYAAICPTHRTAMAGGGPTWTCEQCADETFVAIIPQEAPDAAA